MNEEEIINLLLDSRLSDNDLVANIELAELLLIEESRVILEAISSDLSRSLEVREAALHALSNI